MKFTGRAEFEWVDRNIYDGKTLYIGSVRVGFAYPLTVLNKSKFSWGVYNANPRGLTDTLEEAQSALLSALGIVVEWETPKAEEGEA